MIAFLALAKHLGLLHSIFGLFGERRIDSQLICLIWIWEGNNPHAFFLLLQFFFASIHSFDWQNQ